MTGQAQTTLRRKAGDLFFLAAIAVLGIGLADQATDSRAAEHRLDVYTTAAHHCASQAATLHDARVCLAVLDGRPPPPPTTTTTSTASTVELVPPAGAVAGRTKAGACVVTGASEAEEAKITADPAGQIPPVQP